jgi:hypothetical protein
MDILLSACWTRYFWDGGRAGKCPIRPPGAEIVHAKVSHKGSMEIS